VMDSPGDPGSSLMFELDHPTVLPSVGRDHNGSGSRTGCAAPLVRRAVAGGWSRRDGSSVSEPAGVVGAVCRPGGQLQAEALRVLEHENPPDRRLDHRRMVDAELVQVGGPCFHVVSAGNGEGDRIEALTTMSGDRVDPEADRRVTKARHRTCNATNNAVLVGELEVRTEAEHATVPVDRAGQIGHWDLHMMNA